MEILGILLQWDDRKLEVMEIKKGEFIVDTRLRNHGDRVEGGFGSVHEPMGKGSKVSFGGEDGRYFDGVGDPIGDSMANFNTIWCHQKREGCRTVSRTMEEFSNLLITIFLLAFQY